MLTTSKSLSIASRCKQLLGSLPEVGGNTMPPLLLMPCQAVTLYNNVFWIRSSNDIKQG